MQRVDSTQVTELAARLEHTLPKFQKRRRQCVEEIGAELLSDVREHIGGSGKVQSWQAMYIGSKGGYVAVRAKAKTFTAVKSRTFRQVLTGDAPGKRYSVGWVTNAIEHGRLAAPDSGKGMYRKTADEADGIAQRHVTQFVEAMKQELEG